MKKTIAIILLLTLVLGLSACMQKAPQDKKDEFGDFDEAMDNDGVEVTPPPDAAEPAVEEVEPAQPEDTYVAKVSNVRVETNDVQVKNLLETDAGINVYLKDAYERTVQYVVVGIQSIILYPEEGEPLILNGNRIDVQLDSMRTNWVAKKEIPSGKYTRIEFNLVSPATVKEHKGFENSAKVLTKKLTADLDNMRFEPGKTANIIIDVDLKGSMLVNKSGIKYEYFFKPKPTVKVEKTIVQDGIYVDGSLGLLPSYKEQEFDIVHTPQLIQISEI